MSEYHASDLDFSDMLRALQGYAAIHLAASDPSNSHIKSVVRALHDGSEGGNAILEILHKIPSDHRSEARAIADTMLAFEERSLTGHIVCGTIRQLNESCRQFAARSLEMAATAIEATAWLADDAAERVLAQVPILRFHAARAIH